jgi:hypothetical protein
MSPGMGIYEAGGQPFKLYIQPFGAWGKKDDFVLRGWNIPKMALPISSVKVKVRLYNIYN